MLEEHHEQCGRMFVGQWDQKNEITGTRKDIIVFRNMQGTSNKTPRAIKGSKCVMEMELDV